MVTNTSPMILLDLNRRSEPPGTISTELCPTDAPRAIAVTLVSRPVPPPSQTDTVLMLQLLQSLDTYWRHVGRFCEGFILGKELVGCREMSLVSGLPLSPLLGVLIYWSLTALQPLLVFC